MIHELVTAMAMFTNPTVSRAAGAEAGFVAEQYEDNWRKLHRSYSVGIGGTGLNDQLYDIVEECSKPGWDGYDAEPVSQEAYANAYRFIERLPLDFPAPSIGAEPDGHITFEWYSSPRRTLSVSISPEGEIHYSALLGMTKRYGTEPFFGDLPQEILSLARRVTAA